MFSEERDQSCPDSQRSFWFPPKWWELLNSFIHFLLFLALGPNAMSIPHRCNRCSLGMPQFPFSVVVPEREAEIKWESCARISQLYFFFKLCNTKRTMFLSSSRDCLSWWLDVRALSWVACTWIPVLSFTSRVTLDKLLKLWISVS